MLVLIGIEILKIKFKNVFFIFDTSPKSLFTCDLVP